MAKKLKKAILAGLTAYAASKMLGKPPSPLSDTGKSMDHMLKGKKPDVLEGKGTRGRNPTWWERIIHGGTTKKGWFNKGGITASAWKKHGGAIKTQHARMGKMIKAAQGTHVKSGTMLKARHGTEVRTMGSNPHVPSGGTAYVKTKLNGTLKVKTF